MRAAVALAAASLALGGCPQDEPEAFPYGITSLAVLPAEVSPSNQLVGRLVGDHISSALYRTSFRVVPQSSTLRILGLPESQDLYRRFRSLDSTVGIIEGPLARSMSSRMGAQGLLFPRLALTLSGPVMGSMSLTVRVYDGDSGQRVWQGYAQHAFSGHPGEPAFNLNLNRLTDEVVGQMPRPQSEAR